MVSTHFLFDYNLMLAVVQCNTFQQGSSHVLALKMILPLEIHFISMNQLKNILRENVPSNYALT